TRWHRHRYAAGKARRDRGEKTRAGQRGESDVGWKIGADSRLSVAARVLRQSGHRVSAGALGWRLHSHAATAAESDRARQIGQAIRDEWKLRCGVGHRPDNGGCNEEVRLHHGRIVRDRCRILDAREPARALLKFDWDIG